MAGDEACRELGYGGPTHDVVRRLLCEALEEHEKPRIRLIVDDRWKNVVLDVFEGAHE